MANTTVEVEEFNLVRLVEIIYAIELEIYEQTKCEYFNICLINNGIVTIVKFIGIEIWNLDNDERKYEDTGTDLVYEDLEGFIRKRIMDEIRKLNKIDLINPPELTG